MADELMPPPQEEPKKNGLLNGLAALITALAPTLIMLRFLTADIPPWAEGLAKMGPAFMGIGWVTGLLIWFVPRDSFIRHRIRYDTTHAAMGASENCWMTSKVWPQTSHRYS